MVNDDTNLDNLNKELANLSTPQAVATKAKAKRVTRKRTSAKAKQKVIIEKSRRKTAVARAAITPGKNRIMVNKVDINAFQPRALRDLILEPVNVSSTTRDIARNSDIVVNVRGGGMSGQAQAARSAIAKAIAKSAPDDGVRKMYLEYDRTLIVDDVRQVEPKKYKGPKARARFQKSYR
ncbi:30S ribosomal protein S9 [uncultured archaeon]|nr:30S ribosomal protein S9 [uncultured archaeon]